MSMTDLERQLTEAGFTRLFLYSTGQSLADRFWNNGANKEQLEQIIGAATTSDYAKFLSAELLRKFNVPLQEQFAGTLAKVYAFALQNTATDNSYEVNGNMWGFLSALNDPGSLGRQLVMFGESAIPYLTELLNDHHVILYEGSQEATLGNNLQHRVKDFAAFYISRIRNLPLQLSADHAARDRAIEQLKSSL